MTAVVRGYVGPLIPKGEYQQVDASCPETPSSVTQAPQQTRRSCADVGYFAEI